MKSVLSPGIAGLTLQARTPSRRVLRMQAPRAEKGLGEKIEVSEIATTKCGIAGQSCAAKAPFADVTFCLCNLAGEDQGESLRLEAWGANGWPSSCAAPVPPSQPETHNLDLGWMAGETL